MNGKGYADFYDVESEMKKIEEKEKIAYLKSDARLLKLHARDMLREINIIKKWEVEK